MVFNLEKFLQNNKQLTQVIVNQFYGIGDVLFIEPILRLLSERGLNIIFPIQDQNLWISENIDYVNFVKKSEFHIDYENHDFGFATINGQKREDSLYLPLRFSEQIYQNRRPDDYRISRTCMTDKYRVLGLSPEMWKDLNFKRNYEKEGELKNLVLGDLMGEYDFCNIFYGGIDPEKIDISSIGGEERILVKMNQIEGYSPIDWCGIIEGATKVHTVSTSLIYIIHQIRKNESSYFIYPRFPEEIDLYNVQEFLPDYWNPINKKLKIFSFDNPRSDFPYGILKAEIERSNPIPESYFPLKFLSVNNIDKQVKWKTDNMYFGHWSMFYSPQNTTSFIESQDGRILDTWKWDVSKNGDRIHRKFWEWCVENPGAKGIAIGTHDGTTGEWVEPLILGKIEAVLVEASDNQFAALCNNYKMVMNCKLVNKLITPEPGLFDFYEDLEGDGQVNSVIREHLDKHTQSIKTVKKESISLNDLIIENDLSTNIKWLHLDVEGLDAELIMSLDPSRVVLPDIIIFESLNLTKDSWSGIVDWLLDNGYSVMKTFLNTLAYKNSSKSDSIFQPKKFE